MRLHHPFSSASKKKKESNSYQNDWPGGGGGDRKRDCALGLSRRSALPEKACRSAFVLLTELISMLRSTKFLSYIKCLSSEQPYAQSPFLFPVAFKFGNN